MTNLTALFRPRSIAIIGASGRAGNPFARPLEYLRSHGYTGAIYPINPNYEALSGLTCYPSLAAVPGPVDLALITIPASGAVDAVRRCGEHGVKVAVLFSAGFGETGDEGVERQQELLEAARAGGVRLLGPNCQGVVYLPDDLYLTFTNAAQHPIPAGSTVAYVGQSGAVGGSILDLARESGMGLTAWVSTGNQADLDVLEVARHLIDDPAITVLACYIEAMGDGDRFAALARRARELNKHLVVLRSGRSGAGRRAVASHTGAMVGSGRAFELLATREGVLLVDDVDELLLTAYALSSLPVPAGRRLGAISSSGGAGSLMADHAEAAGLVLPELPEIAQKELAEHIPDFGSVTNPVDVTAQLFNRGFELFAEVCRVVAAQDSVDIVAVLITMVVGDRGRQLAEELVEVAHSIDKPLYVVWLAGLEQTEAGRQVYREGRVPLFASVGMLGKVAGHIATSALGGAWEPPAGGPELPDAAAVAAFGRDACDLAESRGLELLDAIGVRRPATALVHDRAGAEQHVQSAAGPFACKIQARGVLHKSDIGGVELGVSADAVGDVVERLLGSARVPRETLQGVLVQQMAPPGREIIVGVTRPDPGFPQVLTVGAGGVATELYHDLASRVLPVHAADVHAMLRELQSWPLLEGHRGGSPADVDALVDAVLRIARAAELLGDRLQELEVNPMLVHPGTEGVTAVDIVVMFAPTGEGPHA